jgi:DnaJ family protein C protein 8
MQLRYPRPPTGCPGIRHQSAIPQEALLIYPDKMKNLQAPDAFDGLQKVQVELSDDKKRGWLDEAIADVRMLLIHKRK